MKKATKLVPVNEGKLPKNFHEMQKKAWATNTGNPIFMKWSSTHKGSLHPNWKGGKPLCLDCGKKLSTYRCKRCHKCNNKIILAAILRGRPHPAWNKGKKGVMPPAWNKGKLTGSHIICATCKKEFYRRPSMIGKYCSFKCRRPWNTGIPNPKMRGINNHNWKGGVTKMNERIRKSIEYGLWRTAVFERDNYTCIWCGYRSGNGETKELNADHIKSFALYPELRFAIDNGRTLCVPCHKTTETYLKRSKK